MLRQQFPACHIADSPALFGLLADTPRSIKYLKINRGEQGREDLLYHKFLLLYRAHSFFRARTNAVMQGRISEAITL